jgi:hypothetical protein
MEVSTVVQGLASAAFTVIIFLLPFVIKGLFPQLEFWLDAKAHDAQWGVVVTLAKAVAQKVEQLKKQGVIPDNATALKMASQWLHALLISRGIDLPTDDLVTAIESAVNDFPHSTAAPTPVPASTPIQAQ